MVRRILLSSLLSVVLILCVSCSDQSSNPSPPEQPGRQHEIPWPSLANSPWPMNRADPQSTGRSKYRGPSVGALAWQFDTVYAEAGIVLGEDSVAYFAAIAPPHGAPVGRSFLYSVSTRGDSLWTISSTASSMTPLVAADGSVYLGGYDGKMHAFASDGTEKWTFNAGSSIALQSANVGVDGTLYFVTTARVLYALTPEGHVAWQMTDSRFHGGTHSVLSFSPDGQTLYVPGQGPLLLAVNIQTQSVMWTFGTSDRDVLAPIVDCEGHIYVLGPGDSEHAQVPALYCLNPDGSVRWVFAHGNTFDIVNSADPTIDINGNISFAMDTLYSVDYLGNLRWKLKLTGWVDSPLVCDVDGTLYCTIMIASRASATVSITAGGLEGWRFMYNPSYGSDSSPALTSDGRLLLLDWRGRNLYCLE